jgi:hypothetical protein
VTEIPSTAVLVEDYVHRTGEHCASTALRNILAHAGTPLSEGMIFGLSSGLGFFYLRSDALSPTRMFHGRTVTLESDFGRNTGVPLDDRIEPDDAVAWQSLRERVAAGRPVMVSTDTFYLGYHATTSHFPGHRCVVVGYDDASEKVFIADRKFSDYQVCSFEELRHARNAPDYPASSQNQFGDATGPLRLDRPLEEIIPVALARNARAMLAPEIQTTGAMAGELRGGIPAMRELARELPGWKDLEDWSWASRFGYQVVVKRGAAGTFFRSLLADFLRESAPRVPGLEKAAPAAEMDAIAARWCDLAELLRLQSERPDCDPELFARAGRLAGELADREERFFERALAFGERAAG